MHSNQAWILDGAEGEKNLHKSHIYLKTRLKLMKITSENIQTGNL